MRKFVTSRQFNQDTSAAKKAALQGPVIITDRGKPAHVLLSYADYQKLSGPRASLGDLLFMPNAREIESEISTSQEPARAADLV